MANTQAIILIAIFVAALQVELHAPTLAAANRVLPVTWLLEQLAKGSICTGVDLNVGCIPADLAGP